MDNFNFSFPINMIKKEQRIISGIATADNVDKSNDVVEFIASEIAFKNWQGNIREMHAPIAVGKAISYKPIKMKDADGKVLAHGIFAAVPYCIDLIGGPCIETDEAIVKAFRPKKKK